MRASRLAALVTATLGVIVLIAYGIDALAGGPDSSAGSVWGTKLGLSRMPGGQLVLHVLTCPGEQVSDVSLGRSNRTFSTPGQILWRIHSAGHSATSVFTVGSKPTGFMTVKPLTVKPEPRQPLILNIDTHDRHSASFEIDFTSSEVRPGVLFVAGPGFLGTASYVSLTKFDSVRGELCRLQPLGPGG